MKKIVFMAVALMAFAVASAQEDVVAVYNQSTEALKARNFAKAAELLEKVIADGEESEDDTVLGCVENAKKNLPAAYQGMGAMSAAAAMKAEKPEDADAKFADAIANLDKAVAKAKEFKNNAAAAKANAMLAKVYQAQGASAFNSFAKGYAADPKNTDMAMNLAESYFKMDNYAEGMKICEEVAALPSPKYDAAIAAAKAKMGQYTNNQVAKLQQANDFDGIIAMSETIGDKALAQRIAVQAYLLKKDYAKVIELGEAAAEAQTTDEDKSAVYYNLASAYNAKEMKDKAIAAFKKVTTEPYATPAKTAVAELSK